MIWKHQPSLEQLNQTNQASLPEHLGMEFTEIGEDYLMAKMPVDQRTIQPFGILHGGATAALAETMGSVAAMYCIEDPSQYMPVGIELNINHLRSARSGFVYGRVTAIKTGRQIQVWNIEIKNEENKLISVSRLTIAIVERS